MNCKKSHYLTELLHYNPSEKKCSDLPKALQEFQFLLLTAAAAIHNIQNLDLEKFDCVVGENACQIRAIKIALIASKKPGTFDDLNQRIANSLAKIDELLTTHSINSLMRSKNSLRKIIDLNELDIILSLDEMFAIQSYLLSEMKESEPENEFMPCILRKDICVPNKLQEQYPHITSTFLSKLAKRLRRLIAEASVHFVKEAAKDLNDPTLLKMASDFVLEHNALPCIPTFWTFKTLFSLAQKEMIPLVIHVKFIDEVSIGYHVKDEEFLCYTPCKNAKTYLKADLAQIDLAQPACFIQGVIRPKKGQALPSKNEWNETMSKNSVIDVMLAVGADHRQYPDPNQIVPIQIEEYDHYKNLAEKNGFSMNNPTTFFAQHIYCSQVNRKIPSSAKCLSL